MAYSNAGAAFDNLMISEVAAAGPYLKKVGDREETRINAAHCANMQDVYAVAEGRCIPPSTSPKNWPNWSLAKTGIGNLEEPSKYGNTTGYSRNDQHRVSESHPCDEVFE